MQTQQSMIFPQRDVAAVIAARMQKHNGGKYDAIKLPTGWQVVPITVLPAYMPPAKPKPVAVSPAKGDLTVGLKETADTVVLTFDLKSVTPAWVIVWRDGKEMSFGKTTLLDWKVDDDKVHIKLTKKAAKYRGLLAA
ncbi:hypothetical protein [Hyphomicrobium sp.]|uniref:hypothetical protein n=1 Tax=Hyphomicrobium sp. TaxID=82 RepID=UPI001D809D27|nr:hypothetical protein [Hyphomicrobium sp.]MBY0560041.1 hypothetical protein [Hyphomicrobium sp.]